MEFADTVKGHPLRRKRVLRRASVREDNEAIFSTLDTGSVHGADTLHIGPGRRVAGAVPGHGATQQRGLPGGRLRPGRQPVHGGAGPRPGQPRALLESLGGPPQDGHVRAGAAGRRARHRAQPHLAQGVLSSRRSSAVSRPLRRRPRRFQPGPGARALQRPAALGPDRGHAQVAAAAQSRADLSAAPGDEAGRVAVRRGLGGGPGAPRRRTVSRLGPLPRGRPRRRLLQSEAARQRVLRAVVGLLGHELAGQGHQLHAAGSCLRLLFDSLLDDPVWVDPIQSPAPEKYSRQFLAQMPSANLPMLVIVQPRQLVRLRKTPVVRISERYFRVLGSQSHQVVERQARHKHYPWRFDRELFVVVPGQIFGVQRLREQSVPGEKVADRKGVVHAHLVSVDLETFDDEQSTRRLSQLKIFRRFFVSRHAKIAELTLAGENEVGQVGATKEEQVDQARLEIRHGPHERRPTEPVSGVDLQRSLDLVDDDEEQLGHAEVAVSHANVVQSGQSIPVDLSRIRAVSQQRRGQLLFAVVQSPVQRRLTPGHYAIVGIQSTFGRELEQSSDVQVAVGLAGHLEMREARRGIDVIHALAVYREQIRDELVVLLALSRVMYRRGAKHEWRAVFVNRGDVHKNLQFSLSQCSSTPSSEVARSLADVPGECRAHGNLGSAYFSKGSYKESLTAHRYQLVLAMKCKDGQAAAAALTSLGHVYTAIGDLPNALASHKQAVQLVKQQANDKLQEAREIGNVGAVYLAMGEFDSAVSICLLTPIKKLFRFWNGYDEFFCSFFIRRRTVRRTPYFCSRRLSHSAFAHSSPSRRQGRGEPGLLGA
ncbi:unnamed protein product [Trichogramma brassicae]|uniref:Uncharacterized protein n=1 Tax=Trichogramma brassicae TaxID=86971 RepID=A0A6H5IG57_9HYME|nr:unnamed protein product [Trichogramma brassicae]